MKSIIINPMTGEEISYLKRHNILTFGLDPKEQTIVEHAASCDYLVYDCTDEFTDLLAFTALFVIANPLKMSNEHLSLFNTFFSENLDGSIIIFTQQFPIDADFNYYELDFSCVRSFGLKNAIYNLEQMLQLN